MMNKLIFNILLIGLVLVGLSSCNNDDTEESTITNVPMEIASVDTGITVGESTQVITINFALDANQIVDTEVALAVDPSRSTATEGEDFHIVEPVVGVEAYFRNGSFQVELFEDLDAEGDEMVTFILSGVQDPFGATNTKEFTINIRDSIYTTLTLIFDWAPNCDNTDLDIYVMDAAGNGLGYYDAASAACPEIMVVDGWPDGDYFFMQQMYGNELWGTGSNVDYPMTVSAIKGGAFNESFPADETWNSDEDDAVNTGTYNFKEAFKLNVAGTVYTITDAGGNIVVQGLNAPTGSDGKIMRYKDAN